MTSEAQKKAGYLIPEPIRDYELLCVQFFIPNNIYYIGAFTAQLEQLAQWWNWEKTYLPGDTRASQAAQYWRYLIDAYLCIKFNQPKEDDGMPCCDDNPVLTRYSPDGVFQTSPDGGATWVDNPEADPRNTYVQAPPLPGADSDAKKCAAADNVRDIFTQYRDNLVDLLTAGTPLVALIAGILAFIAVITGVSGAAIGISVLLMGLAAELLTLTPAAVEAAIDATALEEFKCLVYCRMGDNGQLTYAAWQSLLQDINGAFSGFAHTFFFQTVNAMGYIGISNAGTIGASTAADCGDCGCSNLCADKYHIWNGIGGGAPPGTYGTILERDGDRIRVQFNGNYITLEVDVSGDCCIADHWTLISGGAAYSTAYNDCGVPFSGGAFQHPVAWEGHCVELLEMQALGADRPVVDIFFSAEC